MGTRAYILTTNDGETISSGACILHSSMPSGIGIAALAAAARGELDQFISAKNAGYTVSKREDLVFKPEEHSLPDFIFKMGGDLVLDAEYTYLFDYSGRPLLKVFHWGRSLYEVSEDAFGLAQFAFRHEELLLSVLSTDDHNVATADGELSLWQLLRTPVSEDFLHGMVIDTQGCNIVRESASSKSLSGVNEITRWPITVWGPKFNTEIEIKSEIACLYKKASLVAKRLSNGKCVGTISFNDTMRDISLLGLKNVVFNSEHQVYEVGRKMVEKNQEKIVWFTIFTELCCWARMEAQSLPHERTKAEWERADRLCRKVEALIKHVCTGKAFDGDETQFLAIINNSTAAVRAKEPI